MKRGFFPRKLNRLGFLLLLIFTLAAAMTGCSREEDRVMTGIRFDRGNGSVWGTQFYIEVRAGEILLTRYFPEGAAQQQTREHIPITAGQWSALCEAVQALELKEARSSFWQNLFPSPQDGGEYRSLTVFWQSPQGETEVTYRWPAGEQAAALESLLRQLAETE